MKHDLKVWPPFFKDIERGNKTYELRKNDRGFELGDILELREYDPNKKDYTGNSTLRRVTYIMTSFQGLEPGYCIMSLGKIQ